MPRRRALTLAALAAAWAGPAAAQDRAAVGPSAQRVAITVADAADAARPIRSGADLEVAIAFTEAATGRPSSGLKPRAWIRRIAPGGAVACESAAWMGRATGAISLDDIALERSFLVAVGDEAGAAPEDRLRVIDPLRQIATANQVSVTPLGDRISAWLIHPTSPRAFVARPRTGDVAAIELPFGGIAPFAGGFAAPTAIAQLGDGIAVLDGEDDARLTILDADGRRVRTAAAGPRPVSLLVPAAGKVLTVAADGSASLVAVGEGGETRLPAGALAGPVAAGGGAILSRGPGRAALVRWIDAPGRATTIDLAFAPDGLSVREDGRFAIAWSDAPAAAAVIDLARGTASAAIPLDAPVDEAASARRAFVLTHRGASVATVIDVSPFETGAAPIDRRVRLPIPDLKRPLGEAGRGRLAGSDERGSAVTVRPGSNVALTISAGGGLTDQAVGALTIRGDTPRLVARFDQRLREEGDGRFVASARLSRGGRYEVVTTTGPGGTTACAPFAAEGPDAEDAPAPALRLVSEPPRAAGGPTRLRLALDNRPAWLSPGRVVVRFDDRAFGGFERVEARLAEDATLDAEIVFPGAGDYVVRIEDAGPAIEPLLLRVAP